QHTAPICNGGYLNIKTGSINSRVILNRIHMEEDAGKSIHDLNETYSCIDLNRAGTPLLEIVTEPCIHSAEEAFQFLTELRKLVRWINVCDGNMEEGSMRCDANISIRPKGETKLGTRVEVKNLNSIRNVKKAIEVEVDRLIGMAEKGEKILQQTRSFDADKGSTFALRSKEEANDYRYFPEPDLPAFFLSDVFIEEVKASLPVLPEALKEQYKTKLGLSEYDAGIICSDKEEAEFYEKLICNHKHYKAAANWMLGPVKEWCNEHHISIKYFPLRPELLSNLIVFTETGQVSFNIASTHLLTALMQQPGADPTTLAKELNLLQENNSSSIEAWVTEALFMMPDKVKEYQSGKKGLLGLFAGQVKKLSKGKADMQQVTTILEKVLNQ
ncbi:MAG: Asp-tRNA(Asn)/Glu-tRNA(Gln) amidotransferase subunit GatB, partial [Ferruginibacter sp.]